MNKNNNWLKLSQTLFVLCLILGVLIVAFGMLNTAPDAGESLGFAIFIYGFPILGIISLINVIGSLVKFRSLSKVDWGFFVASLLLLIASIGMIIRFFQ